MSKPPRELRLKVHPGPYGADIVYDADVSSWMFKEGEYQFVEKSAYDELKFDRDNAMAQFFNLQNKSSEEIIKLTAALKIAKDALHIMSMHYQEGLEWYTTEEWLYVCASHKALKQIEEILK